MTEEIDGYCKITFLPSAHGNGYCATIKGAIGDQANWNDCGYIDIGGLALEPTYDDTSDLRWLAFVKAQLVQQGVTFVANSP